jgi:hypothetical protein
MNGRPPDDAYTPLTIEDTEEQQVRILKAPSYSNGTPVFADAPNAPMPLSRKSFSSALLELRLSGQKSRNKMVLSQGVPLGAVMLIHAKTGGYLYAKKGGGQPGARHTPVHTWIAGDSPGENAEWNIKSVGTGVFTISSKGESLCTLDDQGTSLAVVKPKDITSAESQWKISKLQDGNFSVKHLERDENLCIGLKEAPAYSRVTLTARMASGEESANAWIIKSVQDRVLDEVENVKAASLDQTSDIYYFKETIWDAAFFIGQPCLGRATSVLLGFLLLAQLVAMVIFCVVAENFMLHDPVTPSVLDSLLRFRATTAHDMKFANMVTQQPLGAELCSGDITAFGGNISPILEANRDGAWITLLAIFIWTVVMFGEVDNAYRPYRALSVLPRRTITKLARIPPFDLTHEELLDVLDVDDDGSIVNMDFLWGGEWGICFKEMGNMDRLLILFLIVLPRIVMSVILYIVGVRLLAHTKEVHSLLLLVMSLKFLLDFDELLYQSFAPRRLKHLYKHLKGINVPRSALQEKAESTSSAALPACKCCLLWVVLVIIWVCLIVPFYARLQEAHSIVCSGDINFVSAVDPGTNTIKAQPTPKVSNTLTKDEQGILLYARPDLGSAGFWSPPADLAEAIRQAEDTTAPPPPP